MYKLDILHKIPAYFRNTPYLFKISQLIAKSSVRFSALLINDKEQNYLLLKQGNIYVREDWQAFSLLRSSSGLLVSSGENMRKESETFKTRQAYGNKNVEELNKAFLDQQKQRVFLFTKSIPPQIQKSYVNQTFYDLIQLPHNESVYNTIELLSAQPNNHPITLQVGINILGQYFDQVNKGKINRIDTLLISKFSGGENINQYKGSKFTIPLQQYYNIQWKSDPLPCTLSNGMQGNLNFEVYVSKQK